MQCRAGGGSASVERTHFERSGGPSRPSHPWPRPSGLEARRSRAARLEPKWRSKTGEGAAGPSCPPPPPGPNACVALMRPHAQPSATPRPRLPACDPPAPTRGSTYRYPHEGSRPRRVGDGALRGRGHCPSAGSPPRQSGFPRCFPVVSADFGGGGRLSGGPVRTNRSSITRRHLARAPSERGKMKARRGKGRGRAPARVALWRPPKSLLLLILEDRYLRVKHSFKVEHS